MGRTTSGVRIARRVSAMRMPGPGTTSVRAKRVGTQTQLAANARIARSSRPRYRYPNPGKRTLSNAARQPLSARGASGDVLDAISRGTVLTLGMARSQLRARAFEGVRPGTV